MTPTSQDIPPLVKAVKLAALHQDPYNAYIVSGEPHISPTTLPKRERRSYGMMGNKKWKGYAKSKARKDQVSRIETRRNELLRRLTTGYDVDKKELKREADRSARGRWSGDRFGRAYAAKKNYGDIEGLEQTLKSHLSGGSWPSASVHGTGPHFSKGKPSAPKKTKPAPKPKTKDSKAPEVAKATAGPGFTRPTPMATLLGGGAIGAGGLTLAALLRALARKGR